MHRGKSNGHSTTVFAVVLLLVAALLQLAGAPLAAADVTTNNNDNLRTGWFDDQAHLSPGLVGGNTFGPMFTADVGGQLNGVPRQGAQRGQVYGQPLISNNRLLVATEQNDVYGLDPTTGAQLWTRNLGVAWNPSEVGCGDLTPAIGVTSTPVVDPATHTMYVMSKTYTNGTAAWYLYGIDVLTGAQVSKVLIAGNAANDPTQQFVATKQLQRTGLLLMNGVVYAGFGSHCDSTPYGGWVVGVSTITNQISTLWSARSRPDVDGAGIWQAGAGLVSDGPGQIILSTGNGSVAPYSTPGNNPPAGLGQAVVRLAVQPNGSLMATDFFAPYNAEVSSGWDADLGAGGPLALPDSMGTATYPHLLVEVGKEGYVYLLNRDNLGGYQQGPNGGDQVLARVGSDGGVWGKPTPWGGDGGYIYIATSSAGTSPTATSGELHAYKMGEDSNNNPTISLVGTAPGAFPFGSGSPVVTSDGTASGSAVVWIVWSQNGNGDNAQLRAYKPVPENGSLVLIKAWPIGQASKFSTPIVDNDKVYVGTRDGHVLKFGSPITEPMSGNVSTFPTTTIGQSAQQTVTLTANLPLTVTAASSGTGEFAVGAATPTVGSALTAGQTFTIPISFTPAGYGPRSGTLHIQTSIGAVDLALNGTGRLVQGKIDASPQTISFGGSAVGTPTTRSITLTNIGATDVTVQCVVGPYVLADDDDPVPACGSDPDVTPFTLSGLPSAGRTIGRDESITAGATFRPTTTGVWSAQVAVVTSGGTVLISLAGSAGGPPQMVVLPPAIDFGTVPIGATARAQFTVANTGGTPLTINISKVPVAGKGFSSVTSLAEGTTIAPGASLTEEVEFTPTLHQRTADEWRLAGGGVSTTVTMTGLGVDPGSVSGPAAAPAQWSLNGGAALSGSSLVVTPAANGRTATAFYKTPLDTGYLDVTFTAKFANTVNPGADGLALLLADPAQAQPSSIGHGGGGLGWAGLGGTAVAFDTWQNGSDPSNNFVGVATGFNTNTFDLTWKLTTKDIAALRNKTHPVRVLVAGGLLRVWLDGREIIETAAELPDRVLLGFGASTGGFNDEHTVSDVQITTAPTPVKATAPRSITAAPGDTTATIGWTPPADDGGSDVTGYTVTASPGGKTVTVDATKRSATVTGLSNLQTYRFAVTATTAAGVGAAAAAPAVFPRARLLSVSDVVLARPTAGTGTATFTVRLSATSTSPVTVGYRTADSTLTAGTDYTPVSGTLTFAPGQVARTVSVAVKGSAAHGIDVKYLHLLLSAPSGATVADGDGVARVVNTRGPMAITVDDAVVRQSTSAGTTLSFLLSLNRPVSTGEKVSVAVATSDRTATAAGGDYTRLAPRTVTFATGAGTARVTVPIGRARSGERSEYFALDLSSPSTGAVLARTVARGTILAAEPVPAPAISVADQAAAQPSSGTVSTPVTVTLNRASTTPVTVRYATENGTALAGLDYTAAAGTLTFSPGQTSRTIPVTVRGRANHAPASFVVRLSTPTGGYLADAAARVWLTNARGPVLIGVDDVAVARSASAAAMATFTVTLSAPPAAGETMAVSVATRNGSAVAGTDYIARPLTTLTFTAGQTSRSVQVTLPPGTPTTAKAFSLDLTAPSANAALTRPGAVARIPAS